MKNFYRKCSALFNILLLQFEQISIRFLLAITKNEENKNKIVLKVDKNYNYVIAIDCLKIKYCKKVLQLLIRASNSLITTFFKS